MEFLEQLTASLKAVNVSQSLVPSEAPLDICTVHRSLLINFENEKYIVWYWLNRYFQQYALITIQNIQRRIPDVKKIKNLVTGECSLLLVVS